MFTRMKAQRGIRLSCQTFHESPDLARIAKDEKSRAGGVSGYRFHNEWAAQATIGQKPTPKVRAFSGAPDCSTSTASERKVQKDDRVRRAEPHVQRVVRSEIAVENPSLARNKLMLLRNPPIPRCCGKAWLPEQLVQLGDREPCDVGHLDREGRLT